MRYKTYRYKQVGGRIMYLLDLQTAFKLFNVASLYTEKANIFSGEEVFL